MVQIDYDARLKTLMTSVAADVVALVPGPNMEYFTGLHFHLSERPTIAFVHADGLSFVIPQLPCLSNNFTTSKIEVFRSL